MNTHGRFFPLVILAVFTVFYFIFQTVHYSIDDLKETVLHKQALLRWINLNGSKIQSAQHLTADPTSLQASLQAKNLTAFVQKIESLPNKKIKLTFSNIPFDSLITWLMSLRNTSTLTVNSFSAQKTQPEGTVNAVIVLSSD